jgi:hypothetical protein
MSTGLISPPKNVEEVFSPVALFIFNRPEITQKIVDVLQNLNLSALFVIADGPRLHKPEDEALCKKTREIVDAAPWACEVYRLYRDTNVGCGLSVSGGLDWVFSQVEHCIILEDDCLPNLTFFRFCTELLDRYRFDEGVMMISGDNYLLHQYPIQTSYTFSIYAHIHGWATWARAWGKYDFYMKDWPELRSITWLTKLLGNRRYAQSWMDNFDLAYYESNTNKNCNFWDFQLMFACWKNNVVNIIPSVNLISNIGYGEFATMTFDSEHPLAGLAFEEISFPLKHPDVVVRNYQVDEVLKVTAFGFKPLYIKIYRKILKILGF